MRWNPEREVVDFMYYWEQCRPVAVLVDCVGLTSVQTFCLVVFVFPAPCPLVSHRLCVCHIFYKGNGTECNQSHAPVPDHGGTVSSALPSFPVQMVGSGTRASPVWTVPMAITDANFHLLPLRLSMLLLPESLSPRPTSFSLPLALSSEFFPLMAGDAPSKAFHLLCLLCWAFCWQWPRSCRVKCMMPFNPGILLPLKEQVHSPAPRVGWVERWQPPFQTAAGPVLSHSVLWFLFCLLFKYEVKWPLIKTNRIIFAPAVLEKVKTSPTRWNQCKCSCMRAHPPPEN